ncbi:uncharacterized protein LOC141856827 [Brevipalpus obovatus]|uniref:uncharacterized protein LOC141856827 n=1 Tax=Brevipalpus obovatus TaxID=246614 RepID=UPI003D9F71E4
MWLLVIGSLLVGILVQWPNTSIGSYVHPEEPMSMPSPPPAPMCTCPPTKPIIKYIAIEIPKIVTIPSPPLPRPPPIAAPPPPPKTKTRFIAVQEIHVPVSHPPPSVPSPPPPPPQPLPMPPTYGWNG